MKLFGLFCIGALAQAPSPAKNCADCKVLFKIQKFCINSVDTVLTGLY